MATAAGGCGCFAASTAGRSAPPRVLAWRPVSSSSAPPRPFRREIVTHWRYRPRSHPGAARSARNRHLLAVSTTKSPQRAGSGPNPGRYRHLVVNPAEKSPPRTRSWPIPPPSGDPREEGPPRPGIVADPRTWICRGQGKAAYAPKVFRPQIGARRDENPGRVRRERPARNATFRRTAYSKRPGEVLEGS